MSRGPITGDVVDDRGVPIPDLLVYAQSYDLQSSGTAVTDNAGHFELVGLDDKNLELRTRSLYLVGGANVGRHYELVIPRRTTIRGRVEMNGQPVTSFRVRGAPTPPVRFDDSGGVFQIAVETSWHRSLTIHAEGGALNVVRFTPQPGETIDIGTIELEPTNLIHGRVFDDHDRPVEGARITVASTTLHMSSLGGLTDANGRFSVYSIGGQQQIHAQHDLGAARLSVSDDSSEILLRLTKPSTATVQR